MNLKVVSGWQPVTPVEKSDDPGKLWCESWLTVEVPDSDNEIVVVKEVDLDYYQTCGYICYGHPTHVTTLVGRVTKAWVTTHPELGVPAIRQEGYLYGDDMLASSIYSKMMSMQKAESDPGRHLGVSAEGTAERTSVRDDGVKLLHGCKFWGCAITLRPANKYARFIASPNELAVAASEGSKLKQKDAIERVMSRFGMSYAQAQTIVQKLSGACDVG